MNPIVRVLGLVGLGMMAAGCATIANGTTQAINIDSEPAGAECTLLRGGQQLSNVTTPSPVTVKRDQQTIHVRCKKEGYEETLVVMNSRYETASAGNILLGGVIGMMVDNSSGANAKYDAYVMVRLPPLSATDQTAQASRPKPAAPPEAPPVQQAAAAPAAAAAIPSEAVAPSSVTAGPFDGRYTGGLQLSGRTYTGWTFGSNATLRTLDVGVTNGVGTGTARYVQCPQPGEIKLTISAAGVVSGTGNLVSGDSCTALPVTFEGGAQPGKLALTVRYDDRTAEFSLMAASAPPPAIGR